MAELMNADYPYLRAWNIFMGSPSLFNVFRAREENAPADAIYKTGGENPVWRRFSEIKSSDLQARIYNSARAFSAGLEPIDVARGRDEGG